MRVGLFLQQLSSERKIISLRVFRGFVIEVIGKL